MTVKKGSTGSGTGKTIVVPNSNGKEAEITRTRDLGTCYHHFFINPKDNKENMLIEMKYPGQLEPELENL